MYLEKLKWLSAKLSFCHSNNNSQSKNGFAKKGIAFFIIALLFIVAAIMIKSPKTCFNSDKGIIGLVFAERPNKPLDFIMFTSLFEDFFRGKLFPLSESVYIEKTGMEIQTNMNAFAFAIHNIGCRFFNYPAADWIYRTRIQQFQKEKKLNVKEILELKNFSTAFKVLPYFNGEKKRGTSSHMHQPIFQYSGGMINWKGKFADGKTRELVPNDAFCVQPNTFGIWRDSQTDEKIGAIPLDPEESLPVIFYVLTEMCDWKTGEWKDGEKLRWLICCQYLFAHRVYINPEEIEISGQRLQARFLYHGELPVSMLTILDKSGKQQVVPVVNNRKELCFYGSAAVNQGVYIPLSYLPQIENEEEIILAGGTVVTNLRHFLEEAAQVMENLSLVRKAREGMPGEKISANGEISAYVIRNDHLTEIAQRIGGNGTLEEKVANIMKFVNVALPYSSDHDGDKKEPGYNGPVEILRAPLVALMNRGDDCEGHGTTAASLIASCDENVLVGLIKLIFKPTGDGHIIPMVAGIKNYVRDPFPNYGIFSGVPFAFLEATGSGDTGSEIHQFSPTIRGYKPIYAVVIDDHGPNRKLSIYGFSQFQFALR